MPQEVLTILAPGFEEIEAITPIDVLRRAGLEVCVAGVDSILVEGAHGIGIKADVKLEEYEGDPIAVILPGGMPGAENLAASPIVQTHLKELHAKQCWIAAICASPAVVLAQLGILDERKATCYPGFETRFPAAVEFSEAAVVVDQHVITSRGPGTAFEFSFVIVEKLMGAETAADLKQKMLVQIR